MLKLNYVNHFFGRGLNPEHFIWNEHLKKLEFVFLFKTRWVKNAKNALIFTDLDFSTQNSPNLLAILFESKVQ